MKLVNVGLSVLAMIVLVSLVVALGHSPTQAQSDPTPMPNPWEELDISEELYTRGIELVGEENIEEFAAAINEIEPENIDAFITAFDELSPELQQIVLDGSATYDAENSQFVDESGVVLGPRGERPAEVVTMASMPEGSDFGIEDIWVWTPEINELADANPGLVVRQPIPYTAIDVRATTTNPDIEYGVWMTLEGQVEYVQNFRQEVVSTVGEEGRTITVHDRQGNSVELTISVNEYPPVMQETIWRSDFTQMLFDMFPEEFEGLENLSDRIAKIDELLDRLEAEGSYFEIGERTQRLSRAAFVVMNPDGSLTQYLIFRGEDAGSLGDGFIDAAYLAATALSGQFHLFTGQEVEALAPFLPRHPGGQYQFPITTAENVQETFGLTGVEMTTPQPPNSQ